jgi:hypothetical protein
MPTIAWVNGIAIRMFFNDHAPPHIHAYKDAYEARIAIETGELLSGRLPATARWLVRQWILENRAALMQNWQKARHGEPLERIPDHANDE